MTTRRSLLKGLLAIPVLGKALASESAAVAAVQPISANPTQAAIEAEMVARTSADAKLAESIRVITITNTGSGYTAPPSVVIGESDMERLIRTTRIRTHNESVNKTTETMALLESLKNE